MFIQDGTAHLGQHGPIICTLLIAIVLDVSDDVQLCSTLCYIKEGATLPKGKGMFKVFIPYDM